MIDATSRRPKCLQALHTPGLALVLAFSLFWSTAAGQGQLLGGIRGTVADQQGAVLPGVAITARVNSDNRTYTTNTDRLGYFLLRDLPPGEYEIEALLPGFARLVQPGVLMRAGLSLSLDLVMTVGEVNETLTVSHDAPLLESSTATQAFNISGELQNALPLSTKRNWADAMFMMPGTVNRELAGNQTGVFSVHGAPNNANIALLDGIEVDAAGPFSFDAIGFSSDLISDVQVTTAGLDASRPSAFGATLSVVTRSGTDQLQGAVSLSWQPRRWVGTNAPGGTSNRVELLQPDIAVGGPVLPGRVWFFGAYRYLYNNADIDRTAQQVADLRTVDPAFSPFANRTRAGLPFAKVSGSLSPSHGFALSYLYDRTSRGINSAAYTAPFVDATIGGSAISLQLTSTWSRSLITKVSAAYNDKGSGLELASFDRPARTVHRAAFASAGRLLGSGAIATFDNATSATFRPNYAKTTLAADVTHYREGWWGSHELAGGLYLQPRSTERLTVAYPASGFALEEVILDASGSSPRFIPFHQRVYDADQFTSTFQVRRETSAYAQDTWHITSHLTLSGGLRAIQVHRSDRRFDVVTQNSVDVGMHAAVNYRLGSSSTHGVRASWNRLPERALRQTLSAGTSTVGFVDLYDTNVDGSFETRLVTPGSTQLARDRIVDPDFHQPSVNDVTVGYRLQLPGKILVDAGVVHRRFRDGVAEIETNGLYRDGRFIGYRDERFDQIVLVTNDIWTLPRYTALELVATRQAERLQWLASYTRQRLAVGGTWRPNDPAAVLQPNAFPSHRGISSDATYSYVSAGTTNESSRDHLVKVGWSYSPVEFLQIASTYVYQSGRWSGPVITRLDAPDPSVGPALVALSNGRLVSNPLATTLRFAFPTRGDGQFRLSGVHYWNVRFGTTATLGRTRAHLALDFYNLLNGDRFHALAFGGNQTFNPVFGAGTERQLPRSAQVSVRVAF